MKTTKKTIDLNKMFSQLNENEIGSINGGGAAYWCTLLESYGYSVYDEDGVRNLGNDGGYAFEQACFIASQGDQ